MPPQQQQQTPKQDYLEDGTVDFSGGQDASQVPSHVSPNACFAAVNVSFSQGTLRPRWAWIKKRIQFPTTDLVNPISRVGVPYQEIFNGGRYQCCIPYNIGSDYFLVIVIAGVIYLVNQDTLTATIMKILDVDGGVGKTSLNENTPRLNWAPAGRYTVIFDYPNFPVILDGISARRADPAKFEVPVSVGGAYNQSRLCIFNAGNDLTAGDPVGSLSAPEAPITFLEVEEPSAPFVGQIFELPTDRTEAITAMATLQLTDTSTGIGPLLVGSRNSVYSYQTQLVRTQWEGGQFGSAFVLNAGVAGGRSFINVNSDFFFQARDGQVRSASMSRLEQGKWSRIPVSREVRNWIGDPDPELARFTVMGYFNNKIFATVKPHRVNAYDTERNPIFDYANGGFIVIGLDNISVLGKSYSLDLGHEYASAEWDGLWTGVRPMDFVVNNGRCFVMSKDNDSTNVLYELDPNSTIDRDGDNYRNIPSVVYTKEYDFKLPYQNKALHSIDPEIRSVQGDFKFKVEYRPSHAIKFEDWGSFKHCAPWRTCDMPKDPVVNGFGAHNFRDITIGSPLREGCDLVNNLSYTQFRKVQLRVTMEGKGWEVQGFRIKGYPVPQSELQNLPSRLGCVTIPDECLASDWTIGPFQSCQTPMT